MLGFMRAVACSGRQHKGHHDGKAALFWKSSCYLLRFCTFQASFETFFSCGLSNVSWERGLGHGLGRVTSVSRVFSEGNGGGTKKR